MADSELVTAGMSSIPVFTVLKNNVVLKNIIVNQPLKSIVEINEEDEEELLVGRHPDCNIVLEHPSISRFHLRIHVHRNLRKLFVLDLSSVHGTWISDKRIQPDVQVELAESDTLRLGGSSRVYRLKWIPSSRLDHSFVAGGFLGKNEEDEITASEDESEDEAVQMNDSISLQSDQYEEHRRLQDSLNCSNDHPSLLLNNPILLQVPEGVIKASDELKSPSSSRFAVKKSEIDSEQEVTSKMSGNEEEPDVATDHSEILGQEYERGNAASFLQLQASRTAEKRIEDEIIHESGSFEQVKDSIPLQIYQPEEHKTLQDSFNSTTDHPGVLVSNIILPQVPESGEVVDTSDELKSPRSSKFLANKSHTGMEPEIPSRIPVKDVEHDDAVDHFEILDQQSEMKNNKLVGSNKPIIWSGRGKPASFLRLDTSCMRIEDERGSSRQLVLSKSLFHGVDEEGEAFTPDKENLTPNTYTLLSMKKGCKLEPPSISYKSSPQEPSETQKSRKMMKFKQGSVLNIQSVSKSLFDDEEDAFTPNKENLTPHKYNLERLPKPSKSKQHTPTGTKTKTKSKQGYERVPFQSLFVNSVGNLERSASVRKKSSPCKTNSEASVCFPPAKNSVNPRIEKTTHCHPIQNKWYVVVDSACLLRKESMKALQLLQGVRRTQLIVPRIVVRELDCMKRGRRLFRKSNCEAALALQWIEECLVNTSWWIHVQSSGEESRYVLPTPPGSPRSDGNGGGLFNGGSAVSSLAFSAWGSLVDIVSPTVEDHVLNCALYFMRVKNDGQLAVLSDDVALKIKAMAEGLICETVEEFRESLVNPLSKRFLWADSSPRGLTWSRLDDVVQEEKTRPPSMRSLRSIEASKGLKLILLNESSN